MDNYIEKRNKYVEKLNDKIKTLSYTDYKFKQLGGAVEWNGFKAGDNKLVSANKFRSSINTNTIKSTLENNIKLLEINVNFMTEQYKKYKEIYNSISIAKHTIVLNMANDADKTSLANLHTNTNNVLIEFTNESKKLIDVKLEKDVTEKKISDQNTVLENVKLKFETTKQTEQTLIDKITSSNTSNTKSSAEKSTELVETVNELEKALISMSTLQQIIDTHNEKLTTMNKTATEQIEEVSKTTPK